MGAENREENRPPEDGAIPEDLGEVEDISLAEESVAEDPVESLREELAQTKDRMLRIAAESENYKKRMERERDTLVKYAGENILRELLTTLDNLERALEQGSAPGDDAAAKLASFIEGIELTRKGLLGTLDRFEVKPVDSVGQVFNPNEQEALVMEASGTVPANHVVREFVKGYRYKDRLLRPAKVIVSSGAGA